MYHVTNIFALHAFLTCTIKFIKITQIVSFFGLPDLAGSHGVILIPYCTPNPDISGMHEFWYPRAQKR